MTPQPPENRPPLPVPRTPGLDSTAALLREGYGFIGRRCAMLNTDIFQTRLMLRPVHCAYGREAAEFFYGGGRVGRLGAMPPGVLRLLQDVGSVQQLEGPAHHQRKAMFLAMLGPAGVKALAEQVEREWRNRLPHWRDAGEIVLFDDMRLILTRAAIAWSGLALLEADENWLVRGLSEMIEATGSIGPRKLRALIMRRRCEAWARAAMRTIRGGHAAVADEAPAAVIARHREAEGTSLSLDEAAVELLNLLRPTVAIARFIVFAALALRDHPEEAHDIRAFAMEVRRTAPFFPFIGGRALRDLEWRGMSFPKGSWMLLNLYGTNGDARLWREPEQFHPGRFQDGEPDPYSLVPQGGGAMADGHRCPGEPATQAILEMAVRFLAALSYELPEQDLGVDLTHIPALPASGVVLRNVRY